MPRISVDFFALPDEIYDFVRDWSVRYHLTCVTMTVTPNYSQSIISTLEDFDHALRGATPDRICLGLGHPKMDVSNAYEFMSQNPNWLAVEIGKVNSESIMSSAISAITEDRSYLRIWKALKKDLESRTDSGLWCINPHTKKKAFYKRFRYTKNVAVLCHQGLTLRSFVGWNTFQIEEPE